MEGGKKLEGTTLGKLATVWDKEVCRVRGALEDVPSETNVLILSDLQAAIMAVKKAGWTGKASTRDLKVVMEGIRDRQSRLGLNAVSFGWVMLRLRCRLGGYHQRTVGGLTPTPLSYIYTHILYLVVGSSSNVLSSTRTRTCTQLGPSLVTMISLALFLPIPNIPTIFPLSPARP